MAAPDVLVIRGLPNILDENDLRQLVGHFGAVDVRKEPSRNSCCSVLAKFKSHEDAQYAMHRLHQLDVAGKRITAKYADFTFLPRIHGTNPPNPVVERNRATFVPEFEPATKLVVLKVAQLMLVNPTFYERVRRLMQAMKLELPSETSFYGEIEEVEMEELYKEETETEESELESEEETRLIPANYEDNTSLHLKERKTTKKLIKKPRLSTLINGKGSLPKGQKSQVLVDEVFDRQNLETSKRLTLKIQNNEIKGNDPLQDLETSEGFGKFTPASVDIAIETTEPSAQPTPNDNDFITAQKLQINRMLPAELNLLPVMKTYSTGEPSSRLYIKNLSKQVKEDDLRFIYGRYVTWTSSEESNAY